MTLIDKDAALAVADEVFDLFEKKGDTAGAFAAAEVGERIRALPAVVPGVKADGCPYGFPDEECCGGYCGMEEQHTGHPPASDPQPPLELVQKLHELPAHEPRDDAVAKALEEAAGKLDERGKREQEDFGLSRQTQNFYRARDIVRALTPQSGTDALRQARVEGMRLAEKALRDWQDDLNANRMADSGVTVGMAADVVAQLIAREGGE